MAKTKDILARLRAAREARKLMQEHVAESLGIDRTTYIRKENGFIPITTDEWLRMADVLSVEASCFFAGGKSRGGNGRKACKAAGKEFLLLQLFRSLKAEERRDLFTSIRVALKDVKRKGVKDVLALL